MASAELGQTMRTVTCIKSPNIGSLIIRIGFWGPLYYIYNKEPPKIV